MDNLCSMITNLVGGDWNMTGSFSHIIGNVIIQIDELIFFSGVGIPPTSVEDMMRVVKQLSNHISNHINDMSRPCADCENTEIFIHRLYIDYS